MRISDLPDPGRLNQDYRSASPFPHIVIDDAFDAQELDAVRGEIESARIDPEAPGYGWFGKRRASNLEEFPPAARAFVSQLNAEPFVSWLEQVSGIPDLLPDPTLEGGGIHQIPSGGYLKLHTDFNWHKTLKLHRRINLLLYLNHDWANEWGGNLELWKAQDVGRAGGAPTAEIAPHFNRLVIFSTTDDSYHGHPVPLTCPEERTRNSIALYYYTKARPAEEVRFGQSTMTNYRSESGKRLGIKHSAHQALIKHPGIRKIIDRIFRR